MPRARPSARTTTSTHRPQQRPGRQRVPEARAGANGHPETGNVASALGAVNAPATSVSIRSIAPSPALGPQAFSARPPARRSNARSVHVIATAGTAQRATRARSRVPASSLWRQTLRPYRSKPRRSQLANRISQWTLWRRWIRRPKRHTPQRLPPSSRAPWRHSPQPRQSITSIRRKLPLIRQGLPR